MNLNIYFMSMRQTRKGFIAWAVTLSALIALGMAFYPAISASLSDLLGLFENPMMKSVLSLFAMGPDQLGTLPGFYSTYASIYVILMGGIFAALTVISDLGGELRDKTTEYLLTRPVTRKSVLLTKWLAAVTRIFLLTLVLLVVTLLSFSFFSSQAPIMYFEDERALAKVQSAVKLKPEAVGQVWQLDDDFFKAWMMELISQTVAAEPESMAELNMDERTMIDLVSRLEEDPDQLFEDLIESPEVYMDMFNISQMDKAEFVKIVWDRKREFDGIKRRFQFDPSFHGEMFVMAPGPFMKQIQSHKHRALFISHYPNEERAIVKLLAPYSASRLVKLHLYMFLFMTVIGSMTTALCIGLKEAKNATSAGIGLVLALYFMSNLLKIAPQTSDWTWVSPFGLIDQGLAGPSYVLRPFNVGLLSVEILVFLLVAVLIFEKKDL